MGFTENRKSAIEQILLHSESGEWQMELTIQYNVMILINHLNDMNLTRYYYIIEYNTINFLTDSLA